MGVIGYDGRLRPGSVGAMQNPESQFDAEKIGKVANAQPKYAQDVAKLLSDAGQKSVNYGSKLAQQEQELDAMKDAEDLQLKREQIETERRRILNDKTMTEEQKRAEADKLMPKPPAEGEKKADGEKKEYGSVQEELRARKNELSLRQTAFAAANSIYGEADRMRNSADLAKFGADATVAEANFGAFMEENTPKWIAEGVPLDKVKERIEDEFDKQNIDLVAGLNPEQRDEWRKVRARIVAGHMLRYGQSYNAQQKNATKENINIVVSGAVVGAPSADAAFDGATSIIDSDPGKEAEPNPVARFNNALGAGMASTQNAIANLQNETQNTHAAYVENAKGLLASGDVKGYEELTRETKKQIEVGYSELFKRIEKDKAAMLKRIDAKEGLSEGQKTALKRIVEDKYQKMKDSAEKSKTAALVVHRQKAKSASDSVGKNDFENLKKFLSHDTENITQGALDVHNLLRPNKEVSPDLFSKFAFDWKVRAAYLSMNYGKVAPERQAAHAVTDMKAAIADLNMKANGDMNLFEVRAVLESAATVFGIDSEEYRDIASFAQRNIVNEKNTWGESTKVFVDELFCNGNFSDWQKNASEEDKQLRLRYIGYLDEITDPREYTNAKEDLRKMYRTEEKYRLAMGGGKAFEAARRAKDKVFAGAAEDAARAEAGEDGSKADAPKGTAEHEMQKEIDDLRAGAEIVMAEAKLELAKLELANGTDSLRKLGINSKEGYILKKVGDYWWSIYKEKHPDADREKISPRFSSEYLVIREIRDRYEKEKEEAEYKRAVKRAHELGVPTTYERRTPGYAYNGAYGTGSPPSVEVVPFTLGQLRDRIAKAESDRRDKDEEARKIAELEKELAELKAKRKKD